MQAIVLRLFLPFAILTIAGITAAGIWLALIGKWWALGAGLLWLLASTFVVGFLLAPGLALERPAVSFLQTGRPVWAALMVMLAQFYVCLLTVAWCLFMFHFFTAEASESSLAPLFIWSYGVALCPFMAHLDRHADRGDPVVFSTFFAQIAYGVMGLATAVLDWDLFGAMAVFVMVAALGFVLQTVYAFVLLQADVRTSRTRRRIAS
jgi:hypothetical protein